jgi:uncharacterized protein (DUF4415 family)
MKKPKITLPTKEEEAAINKGIAADRDTLDVDNQWFAKAKPHRGKQKAPTKIPVTIRLDEDIVDSYKAGGKGWQGRINNDLRGSMMHSATRDSTTGQLTLKKRKVRVRDNPKNSA